MTEDDVHRLLAAGRRRLALEVLEANGSMDLEALAEAIVSREDSADGADCEAVKRAKVDLYHRHLPMMDDLGAVEFDRRTGRVRACRIEVVAK